MKNKLLLILLLCVNLWANEVYNVEFSSEEKKFIQNNKNIAIGMLNNFKPFSYIENDTHQGLSVDILTEISKISGLTFDIKTSTWSKVYNDFKSGKMDVISGISHNKQRESFTLFTSSFYEIPIFIFGRKDNKTYTDNDSLIGKKVGISFDIFYKQSLLDLGIEVVEFKSSKEKANALALGKIDYYLASYTSGIKAINTQFLTSLKPIDEYKAIKKEDLRFGIQKKMPLLHSIMEKSLNSISYKTFNRLINKWIVGLNTPLIKNLNFTKKELEYLISYPVIKVHNELKWAPFNFNENGMPEGFSIDYMNLLSSKIGLKVEYVTGTWNELLNKIKRSEIDVMLNIAKTDSREKFLNFTSPYMSAASVIYVRNSNKNKFKKIEDFYGKKLVVIKNFFHEEYIENKFPYIDLLKVDSTIEGLKMVSFGEADGIVSNMAVGEYLKATFNLANLIPSFELKKEPIGLHIAVEKQNVLLASILEKAKAKITKEELLQLKRKWLIKTGLEYGNKLNFSTPEKIYLRGKKKIKMCINPNFMPFESYQNKKYVGLSADYFKLLQEKINIPIEVVPTVNWVNSLENIKNKECEILSMALKTNLVNEELNFSSSYLTLPLVLATNLDVSFISNFNQLKDKTIGVLNGYSLDDKLSSKYPNLKIVNYETSKEALNDVVHGKIFGFLSTVIDIGYVFQNNFIGQLKIAGKFDEQISFSIAVRDDESELLSIFNKLIQNLAQSDIQTILNKYISIKYEKEVKYDYLWQLLFVLLCIAGVYFYRQHMIKKVNLALETLAYTDQLTSLHNRNYFFEQTQKLFSQTKRDDDAFSLLIMNIDNFKEINENYGHLIGDNVLKYISNKVSTNIRQSDILSRFGGEEFIVALPNTTIKGALKLAQNMRKEIEQSTYSYDDNEVNITVSIGICDYNNEKSIEELIHKADTALTEAKESGKNKVVEYVHRYTLN